jgi:hypothetical protein
MLLSAILLLGAPAMSAAAMPMDPCCDEAPCHDLDKSLCPDGCVVACQVVAAPESQIAEPVETGLAPIRSRRPLLAAGTRARPGASAPAVKPSSERPSFNLKSENHHETYPFDGGADAARLGVGRLRRRAGSGDQGRPGLLRPRSGLLQRRSLLLIQP